MAKHFGNCVLVVGNVYTMQDVVAKDSHRAPVHSTVRLKSVEIGEDGCIRVGVAFPADPGDPRDTLGFRAEATCFCFPSMLRPV